MAALVSLSILLEIESKFFPQAYKVVSSTK